MANAANEACSISAPRTLTDKLNAEWHKPALLIYTAVVLVHWSEHFLQAFQVYILGWSLPEARGLLGIPFPWLVSSEALHYGYALIMLIAFWVLRKGFIGRSYYWWMAAFWIQFWHHIEHGLLQYQVLAGRNFFGAPAPISLIQMLGFLEGTAETGFNDLMVGPPRHPFSALMLAVRRVEVHLFYNSIVTIPMVVAMYYHMFPSPVEEAHMNCTCARNKKRPAPAAA
ncbi:MAG TPA: hypothetical protein VNX28_11105 [Gemmataceae bacterium]|jgi:hypothetical protein|nr:hypothetical protein [Gemmataceae bacterium]